MLYKMHKLFGWNNKPQLLSLKLNLIYEKHMISCSDSCESYM